MRVGIVGMGIVGSALLEFFRYGHDCTIFDLFKSGGSKNEINQCQVVFVCVPTPMNKDRSCDTSAIEDVMTWLRTPVRVIKSTVPPGTTDKFGYGTIYNPEFLRAEHAIEDMLNIQSIILGGDLSVSAVVGNLYKSVNSTIKVHYTTAGTAEMTKYATNAFLATKVAFANEINNICNSIDIPYELVKNLLKLDPRIGSSHLDINGRGGFDGACLPKDLEGLLAMATPIKTPLLDGVKAYER